MLVTGWVQPEEARAPLYTAVINAYSFICIRPTGTHLISIVKDRQSVFLKWLQHLPPKWTPVTLKTGSQGSAVFIWPLPSLPFTKEL